MSVLNITLTEDMLKLISCINFTEFPTEEDFENKQKVRVGIDFGSLYGGSFIFEDVSYILGIYDKHIPGTECEPMGPRFPEELEDYMWGIHSYIVEHIKDIEELVHQFIRKGGLVPGTYTCKSNVRIWEFKGETK